MELPTARTSPSCRAPSPKDRIASVLLVKAIKYVLCISPQPQGQRGLIHFNLKISQKHTLSMANSA